MRPLTLLRRAERVFLVTVFLTMVALFAVNVVGREIGGSVASRLTWIEEAVRLLNVFLVFGALGLALERGRHVGIDTLRRRLPAPAQRVLEKVIDAVGCAATLYLAWLAFGLTQFVLGTGQRSPTLNIPMGWLYAAPVVGFCLLALRYALSLFGVIDRFSQAPSAAPAQEESDR
jgi:TRAP-type C4-dicarboxylate transport system permease small subunit